MDKRKLALPIVTGALVSAGIWGILWLGSQFLGYSGETITMLLSYSLAAPAILLDYLIGKDVNLALVLLTAQFPLYGLAIGIPWSRGRKKALAAVVTVLLILHVISILLLFPLFLLIIYGD